MPLSQRHPKEPEPLISHNAQVTMTVWNRFLFFQLFSPSAWIACLHYTTSVTAREGARTGLRLDMHCRPDISCRIGRRWKAIPHVFLLIDSLAVCKFIKIQKCINRSVALRSINTGALMMVTAFKRTAFLFLLTGDNCGVQGGINITLEIQ